MDNDRLIQLRRLATDSLVKFADNEEVFTLAQAVEEMCEGVDDFDSLADKAQALEEENDAP